jgi:hypothetical protein
MPVRPENVSNAQDHDYSNSAFCTNNFTNGFDTIKFNLCQSQESIGSRKDGPVEHITLALLSIEPQKNVKRT